jgi:hypothetical protein
MGGQIAEADEIRDQDIVEAGEWIEGLTGGPIRSAAPLFIFNEQHNLPQQLLGGVFMGFASGIPSGLTPHFP